MALLQLTWKEAKHKYHTTNLADWLDKRMTARHELRVAKQAIGDEVFFTMVLDSFDGGKQGEAYGCRAEAEQVANFIKLQRGRCILISTSLLMASVSELLKVLAR